jgi:glucose/arabinose dehydrogenase
MRALPALALFALAGAAYAQVTPGTINIDLKPVAFGMVSPIVGLAAPDNSGRLFIVDQIGKIWIMQNGAVLPTPFLDVTADMVVPSPGYDERGLLGLAFHPNYTQNGRFFIRYSKSRTGVQGEPCFGTSFGCHEEILAEYQVSPGNPNIASPAGTILFRVNKPEFNHNSGDVVFGPDGFLYFTLGDGGGANDDLHLPNLPHGPIGNGQNIQVPLGKVLRIDVDHGAPYTVPPTNPFIGTGLPEIWAYGLRNPYRFSFDSRPGGDNRMWLTDVGQDMTEELNFGQIGANYGWAVMEGPHCFDPFNTTTPPATCNNAGMTLPIASYDHNEGIAIVGGFVYRGGRVPQMLGKYICGDFARAFTSATGRLFYVDPTNLGGGVRTLNIGPDHRELAMFLKGFAQDQDGEIYALASTRLGPAGAVGQVLKIVSCYANCDDSTQAPVLNVLDFNCFINRFTANDVSANCDLSTAAPILNVLDFNCFLNRFVAGCP